MRKLLVTPSAKAGLAPAFRLASQLKETHTIQSFEASETEPGIEISMYPDDSPATVAEGGIDVRQEAITSRFAQIGYGFVVLPDVDAARAEWDAAHGLKPGDYDKLTPAQRAALEEPPVGAAPDERAAWDKAHGLQPGQWEKMSPAERAALEARA